MKFVGGPFHGCDNGVIMDPLDVGEILTAPQRMQIDGRWYSVDHLYAITGNPGEEADYMVSQFSMDPAETPAEGPLPVDY